jgi:hypothetical protein
MIDYSICYKRQLAPTDPYFATRQFDTLIAAFTSDKRSRALFDKINATRKQWVVFPEYGFQQSECPAGAFIGPDGADEAHLITSLLDTVVSQSDRICVDITGFLAPYLLFLIRSIAARGITTVEMLYAEPGRYLKSEETTFSGEEVRSVRQVYGFEGTHGADTTKDLLVVGAGYDHQLMKMVATTKEGARPIQIFGLPALQPDMYQQNILRAARAAEALGGRGVGEHADNHLVPAHDPFATATFLSKLIEDTPFTNLYLCPLATKPQVAGFGIFYVTECLAKPVSILYPFCGSFPKQTSDGIGRFWAYTIELDLK